MRRRIASTPRGASSHLHGPRTGVLRWTGDVDAETVSRKERPVRLPQHLAGEEDQVRLPFADDAVRLLGLRDQPDGRRRDPGLLADPFGEWDLIPRRHGDP